MAKVDGDGEAMGMYDVHNKPVLCRHAEQWQRGTPKGRFSSKRGEGRRSGWDREPQWHDAVRVDELEAVLTLSPLLSMIAWENGQLYCFKLYR